MVSDHLLNAYTKRVFKVFVFMVSFGNIAWNTFPQPPKPAAYDPVAAQRPGSFIPEKPEQFVWQTTDEISGQKTSGGAIPAFDVTNDNPLTRVGTIAVGVEVSLEKFVTRNSTLYYAIPADLVALNQPNNQGGCSNLPNQNRPQKVYWISGNNIKAVALKK